MELRRARYWILRQIRWIQYIFSPFIPLKYILIISSYIRLCLPSGFFLSIYQLQFCVHLSHACYMFRLFRSLLSDHINKSLRRANHEVSCYVIFLTLLFLSLSLSPLDPDILVSNWFSDTLDLSVYVLPSGYNCSILHSYGTTGKMLVGHLWFGVRLWLSMHKVSGSIISLPPTPT